MKTRILILAVMGLMAGHVLADDSSVIHTFTDANGRSIRAQIIDINIETRQVQLQREDLVEAWVSIDALSAEDVGYIEGWYDSHLLLSGENLQISVQQDKSKPSTNESEGFEIVETPHFSQVTLKNLSTEPIENLRIDYCYYISSQGSGRSLASLDASIPLREERGSLTIGNLDPGKRLVIDTGAVVLSKTIGEEVTQTLFGTTSEDVILDEESMIGISYRIYGSSEDGVIASREFSIPDVLIAWIKQPLQLSKNK